MNIEQPTTQQLATNETSIPGSQPQAQVSPTQPIRSFKIPFIITSIISILALLLAGGSLYFIFVNSHQTTATMPIPASTSDQHINNVKTESNTNKEIFVSSEADWGYSLSIPKEARAIFCDGPCLPDSPDRNLDGEYPGVYLPNDQYPNGLIIGQTVLKGETSSLPPGWEASFPNAVPSDIDFGVPHALMSKGSRSIKIYKDANDSQGETAEYEFVTYIFRKGDYYFMPSIQTNAQKTNFEAYKKIVATWNFTKSDAEYYVADSNE